MQAQAITRQKPKYASFLGGIFTLTEFNEGTFRKRHYQLGDGKNGRPAELELNWSRPDAFKKKYTSEQIHAGIATKEPDLYPPFTDENGESWDALFMPCDGHTIPADIVCEIFTEAEQKASSLRRKKVADPKLKQVA